MATQKKEKNSRKITHFTNKENKDGKKTIRKSPNFTHTQDSKFMKRVIEKEMISNFNINR